MKVFIIGSGGREHALVKQALRSPSVSKIYCAPGNSGIAENCECIGIPADKISELVQFAKTQKIDLTVVGPEQPLTLGIVDEFEKQGLRIFGPSKMASVLEASKIYTKEFCLRHGIPTAGFKTFTNSDEAEKYVQDKNIFPIVIKADGLSAGKGVIICKNFEQAKLAIEGMLVHQKFGDSGQKIVIEDFIKGEEVSFNFIADGEGFLAFPPSQDHKAVFDGDQGPNTGGMGAYAPAPILRDASKKLSVSESVLMPTLKGMIAEGRPYRG
jgi:phosphoribosylamine--glycine ligase